MMNSEELGQIEPILARFAQDIASGLFGARYDPTGDVLTIVLDRPESPVTSHDRAEGVYIDFDPAHARISALTIVNYRSKFIARHAPTGRTAALSRVSLRLMLLLDRLGVRLDAYWDRYANRQRIRQALGDYQATLHREPERLNNLMHIPASA